MLVGGYMGYRKAGSRPSLIGGLVIGGLALYGAMSMFGGNETGRGIALLSSVIAMLFFGWKVSRAVLGGERSTRALGIFLASAAEVAVLVFLVPGDV